MLPPPNPPAPDTLPTPVPLEADLVSLSMTTTLEGRRRKSWGESSGHFFGEHAAQG